MDIPAPNPMDSTTNEIMEDEHIVSDNAFDWLIVSQFAWRFINWAVNLYNVGCWRSSPSDKGRRYSKTRLTVSFFKIKLTPCFYPLLWRWILICLF
jgi:hypothetical protein